MSFMFKVIARNPPTALFVIAAFLIVTGAFSGYGYLVDIGIWCLVLGFILQIAWLVCTKGRF